MLYQPLPTSVDLLERFSRISSGSKNPQGNHAVQKQFADLLKAMGFRVKFHQQKGGSLEMLEAIFRFHPKQQSFVTLVCHSDTLDDPHHRAGSFRLQGGRAIGQGVLDDKAGMVVILKGIEGLLAEGSKCNKALRILCSPNEELGSVGFHQLFRKLSKNTEVVLGFEPALPNGNFVNERAGNVWYEVEILGKESHSGRAPFEGVNAAFEFAQKASQLEKLNQPKLGISVQIGSVKSEKDLFNVVCGRLNFKIDVRFRRLQDEKKITVKVEKILKKSFVKHSKTNFEIKDRCPAMTRSKASQGLERVYSRASRSKGEGTGGSADAAHLCRKGVWALDGLGAKGGNMHQDKEFVDLASIELRSKALTRLLRHL